MYPTRSVPTWCVLCLRFYRSWQTYVYLWHCQQAPATWAAPAQGVAPRASVSGLRLSTLFKQTLLNVTNIGILWVDVGPRPHLALGYGFSHELPVVSLLGNMEKILSLPPLLFGPQLFAPLLFGLTLSAPHSLTPFSEIRNTQLVTKLCCKYKYSIVSLRPLWCQTHLTKRTATITKSIKKKPNRCCLN